MERQNRLIEINENQIEDEHIPNPFVKWAGGKRGIIKELLSRLPTEFNNYYEPFVGGGALFFEVSIQVNQAYISDINFDLILTYQVIKKDPKKLIKLLEEHAKQHNEKYYYEIRTKHNLEDPCEIAARFIYLNKTCYNGLFRTNNKGEFNVPMGSYKNPNIVQEKNILACSKALKNVKVEYREFNTISPTNGDFVYLDPPYHPTDENSFTKYTKSNFTEKDQRRLRDLALKLHKKGVKVMISNSKTKFIQNLYKSNVFKIETISAPRVVNCKSEGRQPTDEYLITNY